MNNLIPTESEIKTFLKNVRIELNNLRLNATDEEKSKLDINKLNASDSIMCIYGQMTGHCNSKRAIELTPKKYEFIINENDNFNLDDLLMDIKDISLIEDEQIYTALEKYLFLIDDKQRGIVIDFIKGDRKTIDVKKLIANSHKN